VPQVRAIVEESEVVLTRVERKVVEIAGPVVNRAGASARQVRQRAGAALKATTVRAGMRAQRWAKVRVQRHRAGRRGRKSRNSPDD